MTPIQEKVVVAKAAKVREMLDALGTLPLERRQVFLADPRMVAAGESFLRRALEALLDLGRHILAKAHDCPVAEYAEIGRRLGELGVLDPAAAGLLERMGRYRNRLTHFYDEVTPDELYDLLTERRGDVEAVLDALLTWVRAHPEMMDRSL